MISFNGAARRLADTDLPRVGHLIGVGEDEIHAIIDVESSGRGFDTRGRPKMLLEPHVFFRNLEGAKRDAAVRAGLAYERWGTAPYPADSYDRLVRAVAIDETAALKAASWGLTQILGENHAGAGFATPQAMVAAFVESEGAQLEATIRLLVTMRIDDDLRAHRWEAVARGWNGAGYAKHGYHLKLQASFSRWARIPDTPWKPTAELAPSPLRPANDNLPAVKPAASGGLPVSAPAPGLLDRVRAAFRRSA